MVNVLVAGVQSAAPAKESSFSVGGGSAATHRRLTARALAAYAATGHECQDNVVAYCRIFDRITHLLDDPGRFVSDRHRRWPWP